MKIIFFASSVALATSLAALPAFGAPVEFFGAGVDAAAITGVRNNFRAAIGGGIVPGAPPGSFGGVRREINWDGVGNAKSAPNDLNADFFNVNSPRGVVFSTFGSGFQLSANSGVAPIEFGNINPNYSNIFQTFSSQRLFTALASNVMDVNFFVAGTTVPGFTSAFGSVFTDVDLADTTKIAFFSGANFLGEFFAPIADNGLSFLGVRFNAGERITRVRITSGNTALGPNVNDSQSTDVVVMDDFIFAEAQAVPEPPTLLLLAAGLLAFAAARKRR